MGNHRRLRRRPSSGEGDGMISLNQLEIFAAVVDCGGFSGAAKRLFMSQSSVSSHVRALENSLECNWSNGPAAERELASCPRGGLGTLEVFSVPLSV